MMLVLTSFLTCFLLIISNVHCGHHGDHGKGYQSSYSVAGYIPYGLDYTGSQGVHRPTGPGYGPGLGYPGGIGPGHGLAGAGLAFLGLPFLEISGAGLSTDFAG
ncbi:hypothetical protein JTE90_020420 [Oedothorax gibbosus]|uniref:Uncharacterized protein n=1 Tax=Oedothorax gibbosus TaxID=931172 RepID=A0AAV6UDL1_9ARAC|nr:hypothetical protein JTE90_020420 [Oedothorax gibbosus]